MSSENKRWGMTAYYTNHPSISVIERPAEESKKDEERPPTVPFGFARVLDKGRPE